MLEQVYVVKRWLLNRFTEFDILVTILYLSVREIVRYSHTARAFCNLE